MIESAAPGLHDAILLGAGVAAVYLVVALLQLLQLRRRPVSSVVREPSVGFSPASNPAHAEPPNFATHLKRSNTEAELAYLRRALDDLRSELNSTRAEVRNLQSKMKPSSAEPQYNDAMKLARQGLEPAAIASRCGMSRGEADLLAALARAPSEQVPPAAMPPPLNRRHERLLERYRAAA